MAITGHDSESKCEDPTRALQKQVAAGLAQSSKARSCCDELAMMCGFKAAMLSTGPDLWGDGLLGGRWSKTA